ncbi:hypothetical protein [Zobellia galactanivorans]|uniref:50S ribosomal protein L29 n=1 Tax=Zobellia galactanivorans (strain DSM 12802 / CCUG 47099 / CIP 106680 / NCIMB 13871 / Dsij) TaxID=63186 RepID=G0L2C8_ZOBGA|nr:hypothetical protein [Zobellia galactanivorans]CAZ98051.1 Putative protein [Zobellia galactanivorans]
MKIADLSIADCKSAIDFIEELKNNRLELLKTQDLDSNKDDTIKSLHELQYNIRNSLFKRLMKMRTKLE